MKKLNKYFCYLAIAALALSLAACFIPLDESGATLTIVLPNSGAASRGAKSAFDGCTYFITLTNDDPSVGTVSRNSTGGSVEITVTPGTWTVKVEAINADDFTVATRIEEGVAVAPGKNNSVNILLYSVLTEASNCQTFKDAFDAANDSNEPSTIVLKDNIELNADDSFIIAANKSLTIVPKGNVKIIRGNKTGPFFEVSSNGELTLGNGNPGNSLTLDGENIPQDGSAIIVHGKLVMNDGVTITGNHNNSTNSRGGGVLVKINANFIMNGGAITYNKAANGGGVYLEAGAEGPYLSFPPYEDVSATFTMKGGTIKDNSITANGKGDSVYVSASLGLNISIIPRATFDTPNPSNITLRGTNPSPDGVHRQ